MSKDKTMTIRVPEDLRAAFVAACERQDLTGSQVLRTFMREYVRSHAQPELEAPKKRK